MKANPQLNLVGDNPSADTIEVLTELLELARSGALTGVAFVAMYKGRQIQTGTAGESSRNPVFTLGALRVMEDRIMSHLTGGR